MDCSSLELKVICCQDLKAFNFFQKLSVYAVVSIFNDELKKEQEHLQQRQKTPVDRDGDGNPEWNHAMSFPTEAISSLHDQWDRLFIKFEMRNDGAVLGKSLGKVQVPLKELIEEFNGAVRFMRYQIKTSDGKSNGVLDFSYKIMGKKKKKNNNNNNGIPDSSLPEKINVPDPTDKVRVQSLYPTFEVETLSRDIFYPSLADVSHPLPKIPAPSPVSPTAYDHHHPCRAFSPFVQPRGMHWYPSEFTNHGCSFCGNPAGVGQFGMVDYNSAWRTNCPGTKSYLLQAPDPETTTNGSCY